MNFGESLAYWYFRLNGFFPLANFVLHRDTANAHDADADLLAVRFPHVSEPVGGQPDDWDNDRFDKWQLGHRAQIVCLACEVKTGRVDAASIARAFDKERLRLAVGRFGVVPTEQQSDLVEELDGRAVAYRGGVTIAKVLIASDKCRRGDETATYHALAIADALAFIQRRLAKYQHQKFAGRMFFPSELIQFMAWQTRVMHAASDEDKASPQWT